MVVVGLTSVDEGEQIPGRDGGDRETLALSAEHVQLINDVRARNAATVVVVEGGSAITMSSFIDDVGAVLLAWYPGQEGGNAIADILFGDVNPSGKLPLTIPRDEAHLPEFDSTGVEVTYGFFHGYRWMDREGHEPLFPFGFGLSYTTYSYDRIELSASSISAKGGLTIDVDVTNTGSRAGEEVVQLYVGYDGSSVERAERDLKAFARVALEAGETQDRFVRAGRRGPRLLRRRREPVARRAHRLHGRGRSIVTAIVGRSRAPSRSSNLRTSRLEDCFELGERFEVLGTTGSSLDFDELGQAQTLALDAEELEVHRVARQALITSAGRQFLRARRDRQSS